MLECSNYCDNCGHADCYTVKEMLYKLKEYEDAEEEGLLVRLPCKIGDAVFCVFNVSKMTDCKIFKIREKPFGYSDIDEIGKTVFLTKREAEVKLKEMEGENAK